MWKRNQSREPLLVRIIDNVSQGDPIPRVWVMYFIVGALCFGLLSFIANGFGLILIPLFILSAFTNIYGCVVLPKRSESFDQSRKVVSFGLGLMLIAAWTKGLLTLGVEDHDIGDKLLTSATWMWVAVGCALLMVSVWQRGLQ